ncbi:MAG: helix-turn-helix domain-containing protein [Myxococcota bacterium]
MPPGSQLVGAIGVLRGVDIADQLRVHAGRPPLYALEVVGTGADTVSAAGAVLRAPAAADVPLDALHTLVVAGSLRDAAGPDPAHLPALARLADAAERLVSICAGAFWLGALGRLDGRRCTTHWLELDTLRRRHPAAHVEPDALYTEDGPVFTSAGATAGIDLALHLVRLDGGGRLARAVARALVVFAHRPGGQSQFSVASALPAGASERIRAVLARIVEDPSADHAVPALARRAGMSERNFARRFREQTGETPAAFVARVRVEAAQRLLLEGDAGVDDVAVRAGFGSVESFRRAFHRTVGVAPAAWRERFR